MKIITIAFASLMLALGSVAVQAQSSFDVDKCVEAGGSFVSCWHEGQTPPHIEGGGGADH